MIELLIERSDKIGEDSFIFNSKTKVEGVCKYGFDDSKSFESTLSAFILKKIHRSLSGISFKIENQFELIRIISALSNTKNKSDIVDVLEEYFKRDTSFNMFTCSDCIDDLFYRAVVRLNSRSPNDMYIIDVITSDTGFDCNKVIIYKHIKGVKSKIVITVEFYNGYNRVSLIRYPNDVFMDNESFDVVLYNDFKNSHETTIYDLWNEINPK